MVPSLRCEASGSHIKSEHKGGEISGRSHEIINELGPTNQSTPQISCPHGWAGKATCSPVYQTSPLSSSAGEKDPGVLLCTEKYGHHRSWSTEGIVPRSLKVQNVRSKVGPRKGQGEQIMDRIPGCENGGGPRWALTDPVS